MVPDKLHMLEHSFDLLFEEEPRTIDVGEEEVLSYQETILNAGASRPLLMLEEQLPDLGAQTSLPLGFE